MKILFDLTPLKFFRYTALSLIFAAASSFGQISCANESPAQFGNVSDSVSAQDRDLRDPETRLLVLHGTYGVANRLKAIMSGAELARRSKRKLVVVWEKVTTGGAAVAADFSELFQHSDIHVFSNANKLEALLKNYRGAGFKMEKYINPAILKSRPHERDEDLAFADEVRKAIADQTVGSVVYAKDFNSLLRGEIEGPGFGNGVPYLLKLRPAAPVAKSMDPWLAENMPKNRSFPVVAIHYRSWIIDGNHKKQPLSELIHPFVKEAEKSIKTNPDVKFFLATDNPDSISVFKEKLGEDRVLTRSSIVERKSLDGMEQAIGDWFIMGRTHYIIGTQGSTFSDLAAHFTKDKKKIIAR